MTEMTVTRAMTKLKTLDKQIQKAIEEAKFVSVKGELAKPEEGSQFAVSQFQSIEDLIALRRKIKSAITSSNAITKVTINGQVYSIAEAIEEKKSIKHKKSLHSKLKQQYSEAVGTVEAHNERMRSNLERETQRHERNERDDSNGSKASKQEFSAEYNRSYMKMHGLELYDPLQARKKIEELDAYITMFNEEVDQVLSESNAITKISI